MSTPAAAASATASAAAPSAHDAYHACACYGHDTTLPDYRHDISIPRTLQGYYATHGGCPCPPRHACSHHHHHNNDTTAATTTTRAAGGGDTARCTRDDATRRAARAHDYLPASGPHVVYKASDDTATASHAHAGSGDAAQLRDAGTACAAHYPNARNYGGTVAQRGYTTLTTAPQLRSGSSNNNNTTTSSATSRGGATKAAAMHERACFLRAMLRDEVMAREDATAARAALEQQVRLLGPHHAAERAQAAVAAATAASRARSAPHAVTSPAEQHAQIMDELRYVAAQPVGCKTNIVRLRYLVEEHERILRDAAAHAA